MDETARQSFTKGNPSIHQMDSGHQSLPWDSKLESFGMRIDDLNRLRVLDDETSTNAHQVTTDNFISYRLNKNDTAKYINEAGLLRWLFRPL